MKILVVDDSRAVRAVLKKTLQSKGYEVIEAVDGRQGVELAFEHKPDLITLDVDMPELNGFDACAEIRKTSTGQNVPIIFVTSNDTLKDRERGFALGASEFFSKNVNAIWNEVAVVVDQILQHTAPLRDSTILVLEKNDNARMVVSSCLKQQGARIIEVDSSQLAVETAAKLSSSIDMVLIDDTYLVDNMKLFAEIRGRAGLLHIPIIVLSDKEGRARVLDYFQAGATDYIAKPFAKEELLARVGSHLRSRNRIKVMGQTISELERLSKLRDEFVAITSHDLKSPLCGISGYAQLLELDDHLNDKEKSYVDKIQTSSEFMLEIINDIVELCRNETALKDTSCESINISNVVTYVVDSLQVMGSAKGVDIELFDSVPGQAIIKGENNKLLRIFNNLISNAIKFTGNGGNVFVLISIKDTKTLQVIVKDTGIGIPESMISTIFDRFTKASRKGTSGEPGTGLGMSITKQLVDQHGGTMEVQSSEGKGTTFTVFFPLAKEVLSNLIYCSRGELI